MLRILRGQFVLSLRPFAREAVSFMLALERAADSECSMPVNAHLRSVFPPIKCRELLLEGNGRFGNRSRERRMISRPEHGRSKLAVFAKRMLWLGLLRADGLRSSGVRLQKPNN